MAALYLGTQTPSTIYLGNKAVQKILLGEQQVFPMKSSTIIEYGFDNPKGLEVSGKIMTSSGKPTNRAGKELPAEIIGKKVSFARVKFAFNTAENPTATAFYALFGLTGGSPESSTSISGGYLCPKKYSVTSNFWDVITYWQTGYGHTAWSDIQEKVPAFASYANWYSGCDIYYMAEVDFQTRKLALYMKNSADAEYTLINNSIAIENEPFELTNNYKYITIGGGAINCKIYLDGCEIQLGNSPEDIFFEWHALSETPEPEPETPETLVSPTINIDSGIVFTGVPQEYAYYGESFNLKGLNVDESLAVQTQCKFGDITGKVWGFYPSYKDTESGNGVVGNIVSEGNRLAIKTTKDNAQAYFNAYSAFKNKLLTFATMIQRTATGYTYQFLYINPDTSETSVFASDTVTANWEEVFPEDKYFFVMGSPNRTTQRMYTEIPAGFMIVVGTKQVNFLYTIRKI